MTHKIKKILTLIVYELVKAFPYLLLFFFLCLSLAAILPSFRGFVNWPAYFFSMVAFSLLLFAGFIKSPKIRQQIIWLVSKYKNEILGLPKTFFAKTALVISIVLVASYKQIQEMDIVVLLFALVSVLFLKNRTYAAALAFVFLLGTVLCVTLDFQFAAHNLAVYTYYFLCIAAVTPAKST